MAAGRDHAARVVPDEAPVQPQAPSPSQSSPPAGISGASASPQLAANGRHRKILLAVASVVVLAALAYGANHFLVRRFQVTTDDAYVRANNTTLGARVSGH